MSDDVAATSKIEDMGTSVVVVNFRTSELTRRAVTSVVDELLVQEVIVVDNASGGPDAQDLRAGLDTTRVRVVVSPTNVGFGQGANLGVAHCSSPLVLLLNSDAVVLPGSIERLARALLERESVGIVAPAVYSADSGDLQRVAHGSFPTLKTVLLRTNHHPPETLTPDWVSGAAMMLRRSDYELLNGFDIAFSMYLEDVDLCRRMRIMGKQVRRELGAGVVHLGGESSRRARDRYRSAHESRLAYADRASLSPPTKVVFRILMRGRLLFEDAREASPRRTR